MASRKAVKVAVRALRDPDNVLGKAYAIALRARAQMMRTGLVPSTDLKHLIAGDLEALAWLAENMPGVFSHIPK